MKSLRYARLGMIAVFVLGLAAVAYLRAADAADSAWGTSYDKALADAKAGKKLIFADFTGSDWCGYCIKLKKEVLDGEEFNKLAKDKFVLLEVDFPNAKPQSDDVKKQNKQLSEKFKIEGYPTIIIMDGDGKELGRIVGYGGKEGWNKELKDILAKQ
jgi:protein disulfide-isomerase